MNGIGGVMKTKTITERAGTSSRWTYESDSASFYTKTETVMINGRIYERKLDGPWKEAEKKSFESPAKRYEELLNETAYFYLGEKTLEGLKVKVYRTVNTRKMLYKENGNTSEANNTATYFFDESGLLVRRESVMENTIKPNNQPGSGSVRKEVKSTSTGMQRTEIDPSIKIEAPQVG